MTLQIFHDPGSLNHRITIESIVETSDGCGGVDVTWVEEAAVWASIRPVRAKRFENALQVDEEQETEVTIRYRDDIKSGWRFRFGGKTLEIVTVTDPDARKRYLVCRTGEQGR